MHTRAEQGRPDRAELGLDARLLRSVSTLVVVLGLLLVLGVVSRTQSGDACMVVAGTDGTTMHAASSRTASDASSASAGLPADRACAWRD